MICVPVIAKAGLDIKRDMAQDDQPCVTQVTKIPSSACQIASPEPHEQYTTTITRMAASDSTAIHSIASLTTHTLYQPTTEKQTPQKIENFLLEFLKETSPKIELVIKTAAIIEAQRLNPSPPQPSIWNRRENIQKLKSITPPLVLASPSQTRQNIWTTPTTTAS